MSGSPSVGSVGMRDAPASGGSALPTTRPGRWSMWLAVAFVVMLAIDSAFVGILGTSTNEAIRTFSSDVMPFFGIGMVLVGFAAGVVGLFAIIRSHERSWVVWATLVPMAFVVFLVVGEFLIPH